MTKAVFGLAALLLVLSCCNGNVKKKAEPVNRKQTLAELKGAVKAIEDSLKNHTLAMDHECNAGIRYAEKCLEIYRNYPKSKEAPVYLDRAHVIFSSCGIHRSAVMYADTLIRFYPNYDNRAMVLESLASAYDISLIPREKEKVKYYYELLLKENPDLPKEQREGYEFRLKNIDLTYEELILLQAGKKPVN